MRGLGEEGDRDGRGQQGVGCGQLNQEVEKILSKK